MEESDLRETLPLHPPEWDERERASLEAGLLRITGLVARPLVLRKEDLARLPRTRHEEAFHCEEGWTVPDVRWEGMQLSDVIALAQPAPEARYIRVCAGTYSIPLTLDEATSALLCDELDDKPLTRDHGAPWRLVLPGGKCFTSVKWVTSLMVSDVPGEATGEQIARKRLAQR